MRIIDMVCDEIEKIEQKGITSTNITTLGQLVDIKKDLVTIDAMENDGYSQRGYSMAYDDGNSYARRGEHYVRGHYSRDGYSMAGNGGYSMNDGYSRDGKRERLEKMMREDGMTEEGIRKYMQYM